VRLKLLVLAGLSAILVLLQNQQVRGSEICYQCITACHVNCGCGTWEDPNYNEPPCNNSCLNNCVYGVCEYQNYCPGGGGGGCSVTGTPCDIASPPCCSGWCQESGGGAYYCT